MGDADQPQSVGLLKEHAAGHDEISPVEVGLVDCLRIPIDEADRPLPR
jgi:hypothetical protein